MKRNHPAYVDGYIPCIVPKKRSTALDGRGLGCFMGCSNHLYCREAVPQNERIVIERNQFMSSISVCLTNNFTIL